MRRLHWLDPVEQKYQRLTAAFPRQKNACVCMFFSCKNEVFNLKILNFQEQRKVNLKGCSRKASALSS